MTGASPVTTILFTPSGRSHENLCIVVTGLAPVMPSVALLQLSREVASGEMICLLLF